MGGIKYSNDDRYGSGRGLSPMGGVPATTNPLPTPVQPKNGTAEDSSDIGLNLARQDDSLSTRYDAQPIPDIGPGGYE